jgi:hypothetical protein
MQGTSIPFPTMLSARSCSRRLSADAAADAAAAFDHFKDRIDRGRGRQHSGWDQTGNGAAGYSAQ